MGERAKLKYLLILFMSNTQPTQIGPFDNLLACEKGANMVYAAAKEIHPKRDIGTVCLSVKAWDFKYKEPPK